MIVYLIVLFTIVQDYFDISVVRWGFIQGIGFAYTPSCMKGFATGSINGPLWFVTVLLQLYVMVFVFKFITHNSSSVTLYTIVCVVLTIFNYLSLLISGAMGKTASKIFERCFYYEERYSFLA